MHSPTDYQLVHNPLLPVDGRARRARRLFRAGRLPSGRWDDASVIGLFDYLVARQACRNRDERCKLNRRHAPLLAALRLRAGDPWRQLEIQARLLTGQTMESIGACIDMTPESISWYEQLFFGVHDRLTATDYIYARAIRGFKSRLPRPPLGEFILGLAYFGGPLVLASALAAVGPHGSLIAETADLTSSEGRLVERIRLAAQLYLLPETKTSSIGIYRALTILNQVLAVHHGAPPATEMAPLAMESVPKLRLKLNKMMTSANKKTSAA